MKMLLTQFDGRYSGRPSKTFNTLNECVDFIELMHSVDMANKVRIVKHKQRGTQYIVLLVSEHVDKH